ncbi:hypothetical protein [Leucobacter sp. GX0328]
MVLKADVAEIKVTLHGITEISNEQQDAIDGHEQRLKTPETKAA